MSQDTNSNKVENTESDSEKEDSVTLLDEKRVKFLRFDHLFKVILLGDDGCGKTSLLKNFVESAICDSNYKPTIGIDFKTKLVDHNEKMIKLQIW